jgi:hypothetical protein
MFRLPGSWIQRARRPLGQAMALVLPGSLLTHWGKFKRLNYEFRAFLVGGDTDD